jgi:hypothetical protein
VGCGGAEPYAYFDPSLRTVTMRQEIMTVSWFATAGSFSQDRSEVTEPDAGTQITQGDNTWTAPTSKQTVYMWVVLHDSRGGSSWKRYRIDVS